MTQNINEISGENMKIFSNGQNFHKLAQNDRRNFLFLAQNKKKIK
jgi:hypothetical protein